MQGVPYGSGTKGTYPDVEHELFGTYSRACLRRPRKYAIWDESTKNSVALSASAEHLVSAEMPLSTISVTRGMMLNREVTDRELHPRGHGSGRLSIGDKIGRGQVPAPD